MKKHIIWRDTVFMTAEELESWAQDIRANCEDFGEDVPEGYAMDERIAEDNADYLDEERACNVRSKLTMLQILPMAVKASIKTPPFF